MVKNKVLKRVLIFGLISIGLLLLGSYTHALVLTRMGLATKSPLFNVYLFHALAALIIYLAIEIVFLKLPSQAGVSFFVGISVKIGLFMILFQDQFSALSQLAMFERLGLLIPMFLFLLLESIALSRLLNNG